MTWTPTPGTIPALAVAHLRTLPLGTRLPSAALAEAIGHDPKSLAAYLAPARDMGWLRSGQVQGQRFNEWWLGPDAMGHPTTPFERLIADATPTLNASIDEAKPEVAPNRKLAPTPQPERPEVPVMYQELAALAEQGMACAAPGTELPIGPMEALDAHVISPLPRIRAGTAPARWGVFSDAERNVGFHIEKAGQKVELEAVEFESLLQFLNRTCGEGAD